MTEIERIATLDFTGTKVRVSTGLPVSKYFGVNVCITQEIEGRAANALVCLRESDVARIARAIEAVREEAARHYEAIC